MNSLFTRGPARSGISLTTNQAHERGRHGSDINMAAFVLIICAPSVRQSGHPAGRGGGNTILKATGACEAAKTVNGT